MRARLHSDFRSMPILKLKPFPVIGCILLLLFSAGCTSLQPAPAQPYVSSLAASTTGSLVETANRITNELNEEDSAFMLISRNVDALNWRLALADQATTSIDAQYFIWENDETGNLLFDRLLRAADRGVRVRLLVDDLALAARDESIVAISSHPNFNIKVFNPIPTRDAIGGLFSFFAQFRQLNRRMHNKLFIVDNTMAIVGGRNIGNPYFGLSREYNFRDLDVLTAGPVVRQISQAFDHYWNTELAYPGQLMTKKAAKNELALLRNRLKEYLADNKTNLQSFPALPHNWSKEMKSLEGNMTTGKGHFLQDDAFQTDDEQIKLIDMLDKVAQPSQKELIVVSPYFIPVSGMLEGMAEMEDMGVNIKLITASMASNNHTAAHSHYKKYRRRIIATGTELFEFRHEPSPYIREQANVSPVTANFVSLHVKTLVGDRRWSFIGSLNLDPRAIDINTENGMYIESATLSEQLADELERFMLPDNAWRVLLDEERNVLYWTSSKGTVHSQPARGFSQRVADFFLRLLPIESQL